jgi:thiol:disulfide interchange protein DsbD
VVYPTPERFEVGEYEAFGWQGETAAFVQITPPKRLSSRDVYRFDVKADWLSCKKECLREETNAYIELTSSWSGGKSAEDAALDALLARVPKPFDDEKQASHEWHRGPRAPNVRLEVEGVELSSFIPATEGSRKGVTAKVVEGGKALSLEFEGPPGPPPHTTYGVLVGSRGKDQESYEVAIPWIDVDERTTKK